MIYSGHVSNLVLLAIGGARYRLTPIIWWFHWIVSIIFAGACCVLIVQCQDHYTVDIVLAVGIAVLLISNTHLEES